MNKIMRSLALVLVMVMCVGALAACSNGSDETKPSVPSTTAPSTTADQDILGIVKEVSSSFVMLELYNVDGEIDYLNLDVNTLTSSGETDYIYINSSAVFDYVSDGKLVDLKSRTLEEGNIVAVIKTVKGIQQFIVLNYKTGTDSTEATNPTESTKPTEGTVTE